MSFRTGRLPSEWEDELERDPRAVYTVVDLMNSTDREAPQESGEQD